MPPPTSPTSTDGSSSSTRWQDKLSDHCRQNSLPPPTFSILSDRRGGRTAWSATVSFHAAFGRPQTVAQARFWYDGQYVNNAREDAAEVADKILGGGNKNLGGGGMAMAMGVNGQTAPGMVGVIGR